MSGNDNKGPNSNNSCVRDGNGKHINTSSNKHSSDCKSRQSNNNTNSKQYVVIVI